MSRGGGKIRVDPEERFDRTQLCAFWNSLLEVTCVKLGWFFKIPHDVRNDQCG